MQAPGMLVFSSLAAGAIERIVGYAREAEARGFRNVLVTEALTDSLALAQHLAGQTARIQVGTGIANIYLRHPLLAALHAMAIDALAPGRMLLGLGTSHVAMNSLFGIAMDKPLTALRQYVEEVRGVFRGEEEGVKALASRGLSAPTAGGRIPIFLAGISPKSIELTGEIADGSLPLNFTPQGLKAVVQGVAAGARRAGRSPAEVTIGLIMHACVCPDRAVAMRSVKNTLSFYAQMPFYNRLFARQGFEREARAIAEAASRGDAAGAAKAISDEMAESVAALGSAQDCRRKAE